MAAVARAGAGATVAGLAGCFPDVGGSWPEVTEACFDQDAVDPVAGASRVVECFRDDSVVEVDGRFEINADAVRPMLDATLDALTDGAAAPWHAILPDFTSAMRIGLKINCLNEMVPTSPAVVKAIVASLKEELAIDGEQIIVWDRRLDEMIPAPPRQLYVPEDIGAQVIGTINSTTDPGGPGYSDPFCGIVADKAPRLSRILTELTDVTINVPVLKSHGISGVTAALKNIFGIIDNPSEYHGNINESLPALYRLPPIRDHIRLTICDALIAVTVGGTSSPPDTYAKRLLASRDPLALDNHALALVNQLRRDKNLDLAAVDPTTTEWLQNGYDLGLGSLDADLVELILDA